ncbi:hypothetical protein DNTS_005556 [Danionella cerebrum]|nr:hypothetical protein DNTS_005556 [Danionella translucida]TRY65710.1 hypothetical protein DNTS_005556 [Danionella translucida]
MSSESEEQVSPLSPKSAPVTPFQQRKESSSSSESNKQGIWEVVEDLRGLKGNVQNPEKQEGLLLKKRKWPMKGWHKRYFVLDKGILTYAKTGTDLKKGRLRGRIDVGLSVMAMKKKSMCIDLDTEDSIYHLKVKSRDVFEKWVNQLRHHRTFRQNEIAMEPPERQTQPDSSNRQRSFICKQSPFLKNSWHQNSQDMEKCCKELSECETSLLELNLLLKNMEVLHRTFSAPAINLLHTEGSKKEKQGRKKSKKSKNYSKENKGTLQRNPDGSRLHKSHPNLVYSEPASADSCLESPDSPTAASQMQEEFCKLAGTVHSVLHSAYTSLCSERDRVKNTLDLISEKDVLDGPRSLLQQVPSDSRGSIPESLSEFFDAKEYLLSGSSSDNEVSDDDSYVSDVSDCTSIEFCRNENGHLREIFVSSDSGTESAVMRRERLPSARVNESVNLWSILRSNIGKDLSKVAMPVQLNEPMNTLQRLCEEMEYCHLLDTAANTHDSHMRMVYVAAFAVSAYACSFTRAGGKPFNPILGETYECLRADKGFRFIAEQVSHHPPVSACHCESKSYTLWQDMRWKNKFWGKSMEIVPMGVTHLELLGFGDRYEWSKVTSCIHNILSGQRWIEHYGEMSIKHSSSTGAVSHCKVTFLKSRSGGLNANEVEGVVTDLEGRVIHSLSGKWNEALYLGKSPSANCIWRAIQLNELEEGLRPLLPPTDTRFRPDQRLLEEGDISGAEEQKERIEVLQRERRRVLQENNMTHSPRFFKRAADDSWISNGTYWDLRKEPRFSKLEFPVLW